jgi:hypothetical protein
MKEEEVKKILAPIKDMYNITFGTSGFYIAKPTFINVEYNTVSEIRDEKNVYVIVAKDEKITSFLALYKDIPKVEFTILTIKK